jgi:proline racemase
MKKHVISVTDAHVAGEPMRLITGGIILKGNSILEKREYMMQHYDHIRTAAMLEPRGHTDMYGAVLTEPSDPQADLGVVFIDTALYNFMCGHGSIGIATIAVETGLVTVEEPTTTVVLETPAGLVTVIVDVKDGKGVGATLQGVPSFLYRGNIPLNVFGKEILIDLVYGGNFFAMVDTEQLGLAHSTDNLEQFIKYGTEIRKLTNSTIEFSHPENPHIKTADDVLFVGKPASQGDTYKSLCFLGKSQIDRSPCGTGTCARMAAQYTRRLLKINEVFHHESIIGTLFEGHVIGETKVGELQAILPAVKGRAFITSFANLIIEDDDPLKKGFSIR